MLWWQWGNLCPTRALEGTSVLTEIVRCKKKKKKISPQLLIFHLSFEDCVCQYLCFHVLYFLFEGHIYCTCFGNVQPGGNPPLTVILHSITIIKDGWSPSCRVFITNGFSLLDGQLTNVRVSSDTIRLDSSEGVTHGLGKVSSPLCGRGSDNIWTGVVLDREDLSLSVIKRCACSIFFRIQQAN